MGRAFLIHFVRYSPPQNLSGTFCTQVKQLSNDFREKLTQNRCDIAPLVPLFKV